MKRGRQGFTLLEVMVAVAILALALTAIFSSEAGAVKMATRARKMGLATLLVRCKMGEIEEDVANKGLPAVYASGTDTCCKESEIEGYSCDWEIEPIVLPDNMFVNQAQDQGAPGSGAPGASSSTQAGPAVAGAAQALAANAPPGGPALNPLVAALGSGTPGTPGASPGQPGQSPLDTFKNMDPAEMLATGGGLGGMASMALQFVYPLLKPAFESQIRRATVTVRWKEGSVSHSFDVTQYLVAEQPVVIDPTTGQPVAGGQQAGQQTGTLPGALPGAAPGQVSGFFGQQAPH